jgi:SsrA-binding protein
MAKKKKTSENNIAQNRKARHNFFIQESLEAGIALEGWEVKSIRANRVSLDESFISIENGEAFLVSAQISPLPTTSTHYTPEPLRKRKLLMKEKEIAAFFRATQQKGLTIVPLSLYWKKCYVKCQIALAKGKKMHDKRDTSKDREWNIEKQRTHKNQFK